MIEGIFCDLENAFDCVSHKSLLPKLEFYGVNHISATSIRRSSLQIMTLTKVIFLQGKNTAWCSTGINFGPTVVHSLHK